MNVELIQDDEPNALLYDSKSRTYGHRAYENTIKYLFDLKDKCKYVKRILSSFWGSMMEKNKRTVILSDTEVDITDDKEICGIRKYDNCTKVKYLKTDKIFKTDYARVGAFLTSYCRLQMQKFITKNFDDENVIRIHTDSVTVLSQKLDKKLISNDIGAFKLEHKGDCYIEHINVVKWT
jgi:predicted house-cleaning NTP pyrophosphatase (Maf/HAM1 superfamily)